MFNAYMLMSPKVRKVYQTLVIRRQIAARVDQWTPEWQHLTEQISRMQQMYDSCENGRIVYLWQWHKQALELAKSA